jgi:hypothetical protein
MGMPFLIKMARYIAMEDAQEVKSETVKKLDSLGNMKDSQ